MDKVIEEFENVLVLQQPDGRIRFEAAHENSGTQLAMHDLYQEIMKLRAAEDEIERLKNEKQIISDLLRYGFLTCNSNGEKKEYGVNVEFNRLDYAQKLHRALIAFAGCDQL